MNEQLPISQVFALAFVIVVLMVAGELANSTLGHRLDAPVRFALRAIWPLTLASILFLNATVLIGKII